MHIGLLSKIRNKSIIKFLRGNRSGFDILNKNTIQYQLALSLNFLYELKKSKPLLKVHFVTRWPLGILNSWNNKVNDQITEYYLKPVFLINNRNHLYYNQVLKRFASLKGDKPDVVIIFDSKQFESVIKECDKANIPSIAIVDSNCNSNNGSYLIPININYKTQTYLHSLIIEVLK